MENAYFLGQSKKGEVENNKDLPTIYEDSPTKNEDTRVDTCSMLGDLIHIVFTICITISLLS